MRTPNVIREYIKNHESSEQGFMDLHRSYARIFTESKPSTDWIGFLALKLSCTRSGAQAADNYVMEMWRVKAKGAPPARPQLVRRIRTFDSACFDLAALFISDRPAGLFSDADTNELAANIQDTIEDFMRDREECADAKS
jgi:hypothetical protein